MLTKLQKCKEASKNVTSTSRSDCKLAGEIFVGGGGAVNDDERKKTKKNAPPRTHNHHTFHYIFRIQDSLKLLYLLMQLFVLVISCILCNH